MLTPGTLNTLFFDAIAQYDRPQAMRYKHNGAYTPISHKEIERRVRHVALGMAAAGAKPGDRIAILSENRPEWAISDYACLTSGVTDVPLYPSLPADQLPYMLNDAGAVAIFVSTAAQAAKVAEIRSHLPALKTVCAFDGKFPGVDCTFAELESRGASADSASATAEYRSRAMAVKPADLATIIYTSGTTGEPKGVMLTHGNIASNVAAARELLPMQDEVTLSFLPLSHIFGRMADYLMFSVGAEICYAESIDKLLQNFGEVHPTFVFSVPRIYEKVYAGAIENARKAGAFKYRLFQWARRVGDRAASERLAGRQPTGALALENAIAQRLVFSKLRARMGGRMRIFVSGSAPLAPEVAKFFYAADLVVLEGYGLTETSPVVSVNTPDHNRIGTVGMPIGNIEVKIAADGEICVRGPGVMLGYYNKPDATREAIDPDGFFHTGDIGELRDGYLVITDRKKDLIKTAGGKAIAPQPIENLVRQNRYVSQAVMIGDRRKFVALLIVPNFEQLEGWAKHKGIAFTTHAQLIANPEVKAKMEREVLDHLQGLATFETPKKVALIEHDFTIEGGELTPTLKVRRRVIDTKYKPIIDALYQEPSDQPAVAGTH
ncbi:MAG TPA: long-chain fatty acid--CoA ligase [Gemmatimonadaceae bacterium]|nr:long-chain fatty acid--CoA ligase [Gemmatimonadaceae bacterium]